jgi:hypothetical protein
MTQWKNAGLISAMLLLSGCVPVTVNTPGIPDELQTISAGHTGCLPAQNDLSNVKFAGADTTWNATCNGKVYLCTGVSDLSNAHSYSCAPAVVQ